MAPTDGSLDDESPKSRLEAQLYEQVNRLREEKNQKIKEIKEHFAAARRNLEVDEEAALSDINYEYQRKSDAALARHSRALIPSLFPPVVSVSFATAQNLLKHFWLVFGHWTDVEKKASPRKTGAFADSHGGDLTSKSGQVLVQEGLLKAPNSRTQVTRARNASDEEDGPPVKRRRHVRRPIEKRLLGEEEKSQGLHDTDKNDDGDKDDETQGPSRKIADDHHDDGAHARPSKKNEDQRYTTSSFGMHQSLHHASVLKSIRRQKKRETKFPPTDMHIAAAGGPIAHHGPRYRPSGTVPRLSLDIYEFQPSSPSSTEGTISPGPMNHTATTDSNISRPPKQQRLFAPKQKYKPTEENLRGFIIESDDDEEDEEEDAEAGCAFRRSPASTARALLQASVTLGGPSVAKAPEEEEETRDEQPNEEHKKEGKSHRCCELSFRGCSLRIIYDEHTILMRELRRIELAPPACSSGTTSTEQYETGVAYYS